MCEALADPPQSFSRADPVLQTGSSGVLRRLDYNTESDLKEQLERLLGRLMFTQVCTRRAELLEPSLRTGWLSGEETALPMGDSAAMQLRYGSMPGTSDRMLVIRIWSALGR